MALRWTVFVEEQGVPPKDELDGTDVGCTHIIATDADGILGAARFKIFENTAKIGRVCVDQDHRGRGIGADLIRFICRTCGSPRALLGAQVDAIPFYERLGFVPVGMVYIDAGIPHRDMEIAL